MAMAVSMIYHCATRYVSRTVSTPITRNVFIGKNLWISSSLPAYALDTTSLNYSPLAISRSIDPLNRRIAARFFWDKQGSVPSYLLPEGEINKYELLVGEYWFFFFFFITNRSLFCGARG